MKSWRSQRKGGDGSPWITATATTTATCTALLLLLTLYWGFCCRPPPPHDQPSLIKPRLPWLDFHHAIEAGGGRSFTSLCTPLPGRHPNTPFLSALIFNRVFASDLFRIRPYECKQWIEYMLYAGVEHIYWYDAAHSHEETMDTHLLPYIRAGLLTYFRFHSLFPGSISEGFHFEQDNSYRHFLANFAQSTKWVVQMDVDEYPFSAVDRDSCFLTRLLREYEAHSPNVTQILLQCLFFAGNPQGDLVDGWVIERYQRRKHDTEGVAEGDRSRQKPIYRADLCEAILQHNPHMVSMKAGATVVASDPQRIRMNHYWGARITGFKPDTVETMGMLMQDSSIQPIACHIKQATRLRKLHRVVLTVDVAAPKKFRAWS